MGAGGLYSDPIFIYQLWKICLAGERLNPYLHEVALKEKLQQLPTFKTRADTAEAAGVRSGADNAGAIRSVLQRIYSVTADAHSCFHTAIVLLSLQLCYKRYCRKKRAECHQ